MIREALLNGALAPLAKHPQFILYQLVPSSTRPGKSDKFPIDHRTGHMPPKGSGGAFYEEMWTDAATACDAAEKLGKNYGVGWVISKEAGIWFLDIDGGLQPDNTWSAVTQEVAGLFPGVAVELSSSQKGLHLFGSGTVPPHGCRNEALGLEFYSEGRFVALTGISASGDPLVDCTAILPGFISKYFPPTTVYAPNSIAGGTLEQEWIAACAQGASPAWNGPEDDASLLERALRSQSARSAFGTSASFFDLWYCTVEVLARCYPPEPGSDRQYDGSSADRALAQHLAFWTGKDCTRIERMMRESLLVRPKWEREDYLKRTILSAVANQTDVLCDKLPEPLPTTMAAATGETRGAKRVTGVTLLSIDDQINHFNGCVYITDLHRALIPGGVLVKPESFKVLYGGYTFVMGYENVKESRDAWEAFTQSQALRHARADTTCFKPDLEPGAVINVGGRAAANVWWPVDIRREVGDATPFITHMNKILPHGEDALILLSYMAACVQYKGHKMQWAPVLQGVEGNGKTFFTLAMAEAIGKRYVHWPKASQLASQFNGWLANKLFYGVEDVYVASGRNEIWEILKPMITGGDGLEIQFKGVDQFSTDICGNFIFNTNHRDGLRKTSNDRRLAIFFCAQQEAEHLTRDGMNGNYFKDLYAWARSGGFAIISELLHTFPIPERYNPTTACQRAPTTTSAKEAIEAGLGGIEQHIIDAVEQDAPGFAGGYISTIAVDRLLERLGMGKQIHLNKRRELICSLGYVVHPHLPGGRVNNIVLPDGAKPRLYLKKGHRDLNIKNPADIARAYTAAQDIRGVTVL